MSFYIVLQRKQRNARSSFSKQIKIWLQLKILTLQVRIQLIQQFANTIQSNGYGKKAFLSVPASLTLEASLVLPLFIFVVVCMILPMNIMNTDRKLQAALESVGEELSSYAYLTAVLESNAVATGYAQVRVSQHVDSTAVTQLNLSRSSILNGDEWLDLMLDYEIHLPFPVLGLKPIKRTLRCRRRAWSGREGKRGIGENDDHEQEDLIVYIGKNSTRYHKSRSCHYLDNALSSVTYEQVGSMRNESGGKYYGCYVCGTGVGTGSTVYIMPNGGSFHGNRLCTAITAYAKAVHLSEVVHLGACSYCSK